MPSRTESLENTIKNLTDQEKIEDALELLEDINIYNKNYSIFHQIATAKGCLKSAFKKSGGEHKN